MKTLTLLRHAKAVARESGGADDKRRLTARGRKAAAWVGRQTRKDRPELVLCSTAERTRETLDFAGAEWPALPEVRYQRGLYLGDAAALLAAVQRVEPAIARLWLVGHNPGLHELARRLAARAEGAERFRELVLRMPTAARAVFESEGEDWHSFGQVALRLVDFAIPPKD